jgi:predicted Rossmann fold flavoprotein
VEIIDCLIIGAGAAGLYCSIQVGRRNRRVLVLDHANKPGKKILMSGGGRCNFTNLEISPKNYLGNNSHFAKSALSQHTQWDFIDWVKSHQISYHEKTQGQLFCNNKAKDLLSALLLDADRAGVELRLNTNVLSVSYEEFSQSFVVKTTSGMIKTSSLVIATGGLSIPTMGATPFAYQLAKQFLIPVVPVRAGLVPFTLDPIDLDQFQSLSGVSLEARLSAQGADFLDGTLFTHRGLSGPAALQISSYWQGGALKIDWMPKQNLRELILNQRKLNGKMTLRNLLAPHLPSRLVSVLLSDEISTKRVADLSHLKQRELENCLHAYTIKPSGTEGYRTAEVTLGGVDTDYLSSKTMQVKSLPSLFFIGEAVDVTGWLGGYNFQWAWSSGWVAGQYC